MSNKNLVILVLAGIVLMTGLFFFYRQEKISENNSVLNDVPAQNLTLEEVIEKADLKGSVLTKSEVESVLVGKWGSLDRNGYEIEFTKNGKMRESLSENSNEALWKLVDFEEGPNEVISTVLFSQNGVFLRQSLDEGKNHFYYKVVQADENRLILLYLHEGGILGFDRIR